MKKERLSKIHGMSATLVTATIKLKTIHDIGVNLKQLGIPAGETLSEAYQDVTNIIDDVYYDLKDLYKEVEND